MSCTDILKVMGQMGKTTEPLAQTDVVQQNMHTDID